MERPDPTPTEATVANANLWAHYLEQEWRRWLNPFGLPSSELVQVTAARVATFLTLVVGGPITRMYQENAPRVAATQPARIDCESDDSNPVAA